MQPDRNLGGAASAAPFFSRLVFHLVWFCGALSTTLILLTACLTIVAVFWRYVLSNPLRWPNDLTGWALVALVMLGVAEAYRRGDHIAMDLVSAALPGRLRFWQEAWAHISVLLVAIVLGAGSWHMVSFSYDWQAFTAGTIELPLWIPQAPMLIGSMLLGLVAIAKLLSHLAAGRPQ